MAAHRLVTKLRIPAALMLAGYWACLFISTHVPQPERFLPPNIWDKGLHFFLYGGLAALMLVNLLLHGPFNWLKVAAVILVVAIVGLFDEVTQIPVGRNFELLDLTADVIGALTATALVAVVAIAIDRLPRRDMRQV